MRRQHRAKNYKAGRVSASLLSLSRYALYTMIVFAPLALGGAPDWAVIIIQWLTLLSLTALLIHKTLEEDWAWVKTPLDKPIAALVLLCLVSTLLSVHRPTSKDAFILLLTYVTIYYLAVNLTRSRSQLRMLVYVIVGVGSFVAIFGVFKYIGANPFPWWDYQNPQHTGRLYSTYYNADHLAGLMEMTLPMGIGLLLTGVYGTQKALIVFLNAFMAIALLLSHSRGGWVGGFVGLTLMAIILAKKNYFSSGKPWAFTIAAILMLFAVAIASTPTVERAMTLEQGAEIGSFSSRVQVWGATLDMIGDHPVLGIGPGNFALLFTQYQPPGFKVRFQHAHNDYLHFVSEAGLLLIPIICWIIFVLFLQAFKKLKSSSRLIQGSAIGALGGITAILVHSAGDFNLHLSANAMIFAILSAMAISPLPKKQKPKRV